MPPAPQGTTRSSAGRQAVPAPSARRRRGAPPSRRQRPRRTPSTPAPSSGLLRRAVPLGLALFEEVVEILLGLLLVHVERIHQLGRENLLRAREHLLLARRKTFLEVADRQIANHLGELEHVAGLHLVAIVLEPAVPVLRHLA